MGRVLLIEAEGLLLAAERQSQELERLLARVERSVGRARPRTQAPAAPAPEEPASGAAGVSRAPAGNAA
jgi:hypothetical protein